MRATMLLFCSPTPTPTLDGIKFSGIRVFDTVRPELAKSFFEVGIGGKRKFVQKQTACWIFTENKPVLSNDRLTRINYAKIGHKEEIICYNFFL